MIRFGEQRVYSSSLIRRLQFRVTGVLDPAHYLHHRYMTRMLARQPAHVPRTILDAGCGAGDHAFYLARRFPGASIRGIDRNIQSIERNAAMAARMGLTNVQFETLDLTGLAWEGHFDLVVCIDVLEHIPQQVKVLHSLARSLAPGGRLLLHMPLKRGRPVPFSGLLREFHEWAEVEHVAEERTFDEFTALVSETGLTLLAAQPTFGYWTGEMATSLFAIPYRNTPLNRVAQLALGFPCRALALADLMGWDSPRYAACILAERR